MRFSEGRKAPGRSGTGVEIFTNWKTGPVFTDKENLFTGDGVNGEMRSTAQKDHSVAYEPGFKKDFYFTYQWHSDSNYGIFLIVMDNLEGFNPKANSDGLSSRAIRNDRENLYVNGNQVFGS